MKDTGTATRARAFVLLREFLPRAGRDYASLRNYDNGAGQHLSVSQLSPYLRHRLISEVEVLTAVLSQHDLQSADKFVQEVAWRSYWKGWLEHHPGVWQDYRRDLSQLMSEPVGAEQQDKIDALLAGESAIACMNDWCAELRETGYLHNHARMWFASIWIFTLGLPWQLGADLFLAHLLDGDAASNTLSWRWVAGLQTRGKHYLARAQNIHKFTRGRYNPIGLLNEEADAVVESALPQSRKLELPGEPPRPRALLLTDDELAPEQLFDLGALEALVVVPTSHLRASQPVSINVTHFAEQAMADAVARITTLKPTVDVRQFDTDPSAIEEWLQSKDMHSLTLAYCPVGPSAEFVARLVNDFTSVDLQFAVSDWDRLVWPHAQRGFFRFKRELPQLLQAGKITSAMARSQLG